MFRTPKLFCWTRFFWIFKSWCSVIFIFFIIFILRLEMLVEK